ncbi:carboxymuconolactone decarboxylase family protein [Streptomyces rapamycinicus]|uniref:carboxymuconolactone decarboxylase family protein n=1 Tax=Streptomyces rapamycinicus TaxID=1226757 RepID=UPI0030B898D9
MTCRFIETRPADGRPPAPVAHTGAAGPNGIRCPLCVAAGIPRRGAVDGAGQAERWAASAVRDLAPALAGYSEDVLFGQVWENPDLSPRERSLVTVASLITGGSTEQLAFHLGRARENGVSDKELIETITHLAFYAGWPKAMSALTVARTVLTGS